MPTVQARAGLTLIQLCLAVCPCVSRLAQAHCCPIHCLARPAIVAHSALTWQLFDLAVGTSEAQWAHAAEVASTVEAGGSILTWVGETLVHINMAPLPSKASQAGAGVGGVPCDAVLNTLPSIQAGPQREADGGCIAAAPHLHLGIIDSEHPAPGDTHICRHLHVSDVIGAGSRDVEVALSITSVKTCLRRNAAEPGKVPPTAGVHTSGPGDGLIVEDGEGELAVRDEDNLESVYR